MAINLHEVQKRVMENRPDQLLLSSNMILAAHWDSDAFVNEREGCVVLRCSNTDGVRGRQALTVMDIMEAGDLDQLIRSKWAAAMDGDIRPADCVSMPKGAATVTRASILMKIEYLQVARARYLIDGPTVRTDTFLTNIREELDELDNLLQALDDQQRRENHGGQ